VTGISVENFLQLIEMEQKSCVLEILGKNRQRGYFYFNQGVLYETGYGRSSNEKAALDMIAWEDVQLSFRSIPKKNPRER
jgi:hypothetical protein